MAVARVARGPRTLRGRLLRAALVVAVATATMATFGLASLTSAASTPAASTQAGSAPAPAASAREARVLDLIGHRGSAKERPENTLTAVRHAIELGADAVELDLIFTEDNRKAIFHDVTLDRLTTCTGRVQDTTWAELRRCEVDIKADSGFAGERIPSLGKVLRMLSATDVSLYIHVKAVKKGKQAAGLVRAVRKSGMDDGRAVIFAGEDRWLNRIRKAGADWADMGRLFSNPSGWKARYGTLVPYNTPITRALVDAAHRAGKLVVAVESKPLVVDQLAGLNLDGFMANDVRGAYSALNASDPSA